MSAIHGNEINPVHARRRFDRAAKLFAGADFVHRHTGEGLLQRLLPISIRPDRILDLGSALGAGSRQLAKQFKKARIISLDGSAHMLCDASRRKGWFSKIHEVQADAGQLPLRAGCMDLVFANMLLPLIDDLPGCLAEVARVLRKDGAFLFSTLGPDSLAELRAAWSHIDDGCHVRRFPDMHDLGDAVLRAGLRDPVLDVDALDISYRSPAALFADLTATGARNSLRDRRRSLVGKGPISLLSKHLCGEQTGGLLRLRLELVYGHAWGGGPSFGPAEFRLAPEDITRRHK